jgi:hypothetical protein
MSACAARLSYAHRGRKPDAGRPRGSNWDTTTLLAASGKLGACRPLPLSGLTVAESESTSGSESLGTRKIRHVPPAPPVPVGILLPPMGSMGHRPRLGPPPKAAAAIAAPKRGQSSEKGTELCSSGTIGAHAQNGETATETNGDKGAAARKPQQPLQSPMATVKTLVVLSILALLAVANAQNATRPTRGPITPPTRPPNTDRPSRVRSAPRHAMRRPRCMLRFPSRFSVLFVFRRPSS